MSNSNSSKDSFINSLAPSALNVARRTGVDPRIIIAQAALETNWGSSAPGNNYFGIKNHGIGKGQTLKTGEFINGKPVSITDSFRTYDNPDDSVRGYGQFLTENKRYEPMLRATGLDAQLDALQASGYATDPNYSRKVGRIARALSVNENGAIGYAPERKITSGEEAINSILSGGKKSQPATNYSGMRYMREWTGEGEPPDDVFIDPSGQYESLFTKPEVKSSELKLPDGQPTQIQANEQQTDADLPQGVYRDDEANYLTQQLNQKDTGRFIAVPADEAEKWQEDWKKKNQSQGMVGDIIPLLKLGAADAMESIDHAIFSIPGIGPKIKQGADWLDTTLNGQTSQEGLDKFREQVTASLSPRTQEAQAKDWISDDYKAGPAWSDPYSYAAGLIESAPSTVATMAPAGLMARGAGLKAIARGASKATAAKAVAKAATIGGGITEGLLTGGSTAASIEKEFNQIPRSVFENSDAVQSLVDQGLSFEDAVTSVKNDAKSQGLLLGGFAGGVFGGQGDRVLAKIITEKIGGGIRRRALRGMLKGTVAEGLLEEMPQEAGQQMAQNKAMQTVDPERPIMEGVPNAAAGGLAIGGAMGGAMGGAAGIAAPKGPIRSALDAGANKDEQTFPTEPEKTAPSPQAPMPTVNEGPIAPDQNAAIPIGTQVRIAADGLEPQIGNVAGGNGEFLDITDPNTGEIYKAPVSAVSPITLPEPAVPQETKTKKLTLPNVNSVEENIPVDREGQEASDVRSEPVRKQKQVPVANIERRPAAGSNVIAEMPDGSQQIAKVATWKGNEALIKLADGNELVMPDNQLFVDGRSEKEIAAEDAKITPPVERQTFKSPLARHLFGNTVVLPDELHSRLFDLGLERKADMKSFGSTAFELNQKPTIEQLSLAKTFKVAPDAVGQMADHYQHIVARAAREARSKLPVQMHKFSQQRLQQMQRDYERANDILSQQPTIGENIPDIVLPKRWKEMDIPTRTSLLANAHVKRAPKFEWHDFSPAIQRKLANVMLSNADNTAPVVEATQPISNSIETTDETQIPLGSPTQLINDNPATKTTEEQPLKWFGSLKKANEYIVRKGLKKTHHVVQNRRRYEIHTLPTATATAKKGDVTTKVDDTIEKTQSPSTQDMTEKTGSSNPLQVKKAGAGINAIIIDPSDTREKKVVVSQNKIFTEEAAEAARKLLRSKLTQLNAGLDPEMMQAGIMLAGYHIEKGARTFVAYAKAMVNDMGNVVKPYLKSWYMGVKYDPRASDFEGMSDAAEVEQTNIEDIFVKGDQKTKQQETQQPEKPKQSALRGEKPDYQLNDDYGVQHIYDQATEYADGDTDPGKNAKTAFLRDGRDYLKAIALELSREGYIQHIDKKGHGLRSVTVDEGGAATSGEVKLTLNNPKSGQNFYAVLGDFSPANVPHNKSHISLMYRYSDKDGDIYATRGKNQYTAPNMTAREFADMIIAKSQQPTKFVGKANEQSNDPKQSKADGTGALEGISAGNGEETESGRPAGSGVEQPHRTDTNRDEGTGTKRNSTGRSLADGSGELFDTSTRERRSSGLDDRASDSKRIARVANIGGKRDSQSAREGLGPTSQATPADQQAADYTLSSEDAIGEGGAKTKFRANVDAIKVLRTLESEKRPATRQEQAILAKWVGWGGLRNAFPRQDGTVSAGWENEARELKSLLSESEYKAAQSSTRNAFYTRPEIINAMWSIADRLGFKGGNVLEPSVGVGSFVGLMPSTKRDQSSITGVELDNITGGIAKNLYPKANIQAPVAFQDFVTPDDYFDLVIGNPPFGSERLYDAKRKHLNNFSIHNYFFAKSIDALRPGGTAIMVVTNSFLDANEENARHYIGKKADLVGAIRLPNNAFLKNAGTEVTTDIIVLKKRQEGEKPLDQSWLKTTNWTDANGKTVPLNQYFSNHPEQMLGEFGAYGSMYHEDSPALIARDGDNLSQLLENAIKALPQDIMSVSHDIRQETIQVADNVEDALVGSYFVDKSGEINIRLPDHLGNQRSEPAVFSNEKAKERVKGLIRIRDAFSRLRRAQIDPTASDQKIENLRNRLNKVYDAFVKQNGPIHADSNYRLMRDDPTWPQLSALEEKFDKGISAAIAKKTGEKTRQPSAKKAAIFTVRTQQPWHKPTKATSAKDALALTLADVGFVDMPAIEKLYGKTQNEIIEELGSLIYKTPAGSYQTADEYLTGNVRKKLVEAKQAAENDPTFLTNVQALENVIPADIEAVDISVKPGAPWVPAKHILDFIHKIAETNDAKVFYEKYQSKWMISNINPMPSAQTKWATSRVSVKDVLNAALNGSTLTVRDRVDRETTVVNQDATEAANQKIDNIKREWDKWLWSDDERRQELTRLYNDTFNTNVLRHYDGSHLTLPGKVGDDIIALRPHQKNFVWRALQNGTALADHTVGAGKTFALIASVMEMRRMGRAKKPMIVVPNHLVGQWAADFIKLYPDAKVLAATKRDFEKNHRKQFFARVATGDWDAVVIAHSSFGKIGVDPAFEERFINHEIDLVMSAIAAAEEETGKKSRNVAQLTKKIDSLREKLKSLADTGTKDEGLNFMELGVDALVVDEAHEFKNLAFNTSMQRVAGLGNQNGSNKAFDLYMKSRYVLEQTGGRNIIFATGTPISNTMAEMYTMQRYLDQGGLRDLGVENFDAWAKVFGEVVTDWELSPSGTYKLNSRFAKFTNMPELMQRYRSFADVITNDDIKKQLAERGEKLPLPRVKGGKPQNIVVDRSPAQATFIESLVSRADHLPKRPKKGDDNMLKIMSDARKAALDMRLIDPTAPDFPGSKVNCAADQITRIYNKWNADKGTQLVFIDLSTPSKARAKETDNLHELVEKAEKGDERAQAALEKISSDEIDALSSSFSVYDDLKDKLIKRGIPENQIAFIHDANTDLQKEELFGKVRSGIVRVLFGSTPKMGAGTNVQNRLVALHHLDAPWRPSDLEQRDGRGIRQGNELYDADPDGFELEILRYATKNTLDARQWQTIESKARFVQQIRKGDLKTREIEDIGGEAANAAEMKAAASGNPLILEEMDLRKKLRQLTGLSREHQREQNRIKDSIRNMDAAIKTAQKAIPLAKEDAQKVNSTPKAFEAKFNGKNITKMKDAGAAIIATGRAMLNEQVKTRSIGQYSGFDVFLDKNSSIYSENAMVLRLEGARSYEIEINDITTADATGLAIKMANRIAAIKNEPAEFEKLIKFNEGQIADFKKQIKPFERADELQDVHDRHDKIIEELKPKEKPIEQENNATDVKASIADQQNEEKLSEQQVLTELREGKIGKLVDSLLSNKKLKIESETRQTPITAQAWTDSNGTIHLIPSRIKKGNAQAVLLHEAFHAGVHKLIGDQRWQQLMRDLSRLYKQFSQSHGKAKNFFNTARTRVQNAQSQIGVMNDMLTAEEFGAYALEEYERAPKAVFRWAENLIGHVKAWLYRTFGKQIGQVTPAELRALSIAALRDHALPSTTETIRFSVGDNKFVQAAKIIRQARTFDEARAAAKDFQGKILTNRESGLQAVVSRNTLDKMLSHKAVAKSESPASHSLAVANLDELFERAIYGWNKPDTRPIDSGIAAIHRLFAPLHLADGRILLAKLTVKEVTSKKNNNPLYTVEAVELDETSPANYWVRSARNSDRTVQPIIHVAEDKSNIDAFAFKDNSVEVENLADGIEKHNTGIKNARTKYSIIPDTDVLRDGVSVSRIVENLKGRLTDLQPKILKTIPLNYFTELAQPNMTAVADYMREKRALDAYRGKKHAEADAIAQRWLKYTRLGKDKVQQLSSLMHESTLAGVDPSKTDDEAQAHPDYVRLRKEYNALPPVGRQLYQDVRDAYLQQSRELDDIILANVERMEEIAQERADAEFDREKTKIEQSSLDPLGKRQALEELEKAYKVKRQRSKWALKARLMRLRETFEANRVDGPYFPLARFGQYYVSVKNRDGEVISFSRREHVADRDRLAKEMKRDFPNDIIETGVLEQGKTPRDALDPRIIAELEGILGHSALTSSEASTVMDQIWQRYLQLMPDLSVRKKFIHRKGTAGFDADALRAFSSHMFHASHQMGRLKYGINLEEYVNQANDQAKKADDTTRAQMLANELRSRHQWVMNPTGSKFAQTMTSTAFVWYLSTSPAAAIVNMSQTPMLGIPILAARFGSFTKAAGAILRAAKDSLVGRGSIENADLTADEKQAMKAFYDSGLIDRTQSHDLAGVGETGVEYSPLRSKVMQIISWAFHRAEVWNREVTALAAYRMARNSGQNIQSAIDSAHDLTWKTHFDYSNSSRPAIMQNDFAKVALVFRSYNINMIYRIFRDLHQAFKGQTKEARKEARTQLVGIFGMMGLMAGTTGIFGFNLAMSLLGAAFGDDDDPYDFSERYKTAVIDLLGPELGGVLLNGVPGHYFGIDLTNRIGMPDIWFRSPNRDLQGKDEFDYWVMNALGANVSMVGDAWRGINLIKDGNTARGVEALAPKWTRDLLKSWRYYNEGLTSLNGDQVLSRGEIDMWDIIAQSMGFTPAKITETWERNSALKNAEQRIVKQRRSLINAWAMAVASKDEDAKIEALQAIKRFNHVPRNRDVAITGDTLKRSFKQRQTIARKKQDGVLIQNQNLGNSLRKDLPKTIYR